MIPDILQLPDLRGQAGLHAWSEVHIGPLCFIALQHSYRGSVGFVSSAPPPTRGHGSATPRAARKKDASRPASKVAEAAQNGWQVVRQFVSIDSTQLTKASSVMHHTVAARLGPLGRGLRLERGAAGHGVDKLTTRFVTNCGGTSPGTLIERFL